MDQKKHSACDECRARKLRCTGEDSGCARCANDQTPCHYSFQKPMGRPRKRRRANSDDGAPPLHVEILEVHQAHPAYHHHPDNIIINNNNNTLHVPADPGHLGENLYVMWDDEWSQLCGSIQGKNKLFTGDFEWMNDELPHLQTVRQRQEHMEIIQEQLASNVGIYPPPNPAPMSMSMPISSADTNGVFNFTANSTPPGCNLPTCTCSLDLFSTITTLQTTPPTSDIQHCLLISRGALANVKSSLACTSCLGSMTSAYSSFMLLSIVLPLLVLFYRRTLESISRLDAAWKFMATAAVKKEFAELWVVVADMERLSKRKPIVRDPDRACEVGPDGMDPPLCQKILNTVKFVASTLANDL